MKVYLLLLFLLFALGFKAGHVAVAQVEHARATQDAMIAKALAEE